MEMPLKPNVLEDMGRDVSQRTLFIPEEPKADV